MASSSVGADGSGASNALGVRRLLVHRDAHVVDHVDDVFDLLRIDDLRRQVIVHLRVGQVALFLAARDQQLELRLALFGQHVAARRKVDEFGVAFLALLAIGRRGAAAAAAAARAAASFCAALSSTTLPFASVAGAATLSGALPFTSGFFTSTCFSTCLPLNACLSNACAHARSFGMRGSSGLGRLLGQLFRGGSSGALVLLSHEFPTPKAY